jgi:PAS domain S-box-containing protein
VASRAQKLHRSSANRRDSLRTRFKHLQNSLFEPSHTVTDPYVRRACRIMAMVLFANVVLSITTAICLLLDPDFLGSYTPLLALTSFVFIVTSFSGYRSCKRGNHTFAAQLFCLSIVVLSLGLAYPSASTFQLTFSYFVVLGVFISSVFLTPRFSVAMVALSVIVLLMYAWISPIATLRDVAFGPLFFISLVCTSILLLMVYRNQIEQARLAEAHTREQLLRTLVDNIPAFIYVKNLQGEYVLSNRAHYEASGFTHEHEIIGKTVFDTQPAEYAQRFHDDDLRVLRNEMSQLTIEETTQDAKGKKMVVDTTKVPLRDAQGTVNALLGITWDMTQQKAIDEQIRQHALLENALKNERELGELKTMMMHTISHEFRTPLAIAVTATEMLERYYDRMPPERRAESLQRIRTNALHVSSMLDDVTSLLKMQGGYLAFHPIAPFDLVKFMQALIQDFTKTQVVPPQLVLRTHGELNAIRADDRLLRNIVVNLLSNAIKYSPSGYPIRIECRRSGDSLIVIVADEGIGIAEQHLEKIFEPFYRAENVAHINGTGLGLKIVHDCVKIYGGTIAVDSTLGMGTTFTVTLPA